MLQSEYTIIVKSQNYISQMGKVERGKRSSNSTKPKVEQYKEKVDLSNSVYHDQDKFNQSRNKNIIVLDSGALELKLKFK